MYGRVYSYIYIYIYIVTCNDFPTYIHKHTRAYKYTKDPVAWGATPR